MGKKRKSEDFDEAKILRKIKKLQEKLKGKQEEARSPSLSVPEEGDNSAEDCDEQSIYLPPSEWAGTVSSLPEEWQHSHSPQHSPEAQPVAASFSPQPGLSSASAAPAESLVQAQSDLDESILLLLGDAPKPETVFGNNIHKDIAARWQEILLKGLPKEAKDKLVSEYLIPANCHLLEPPILNPEAKAALPDALVKRDFSLLSRQKQLAAAVAALTQVTEMLISKDTCKERLLKYVSDASRLICDSHNLETKTRRSFVIASINNRLKGTLIDTQRDKYLFGENLTEKLNAAKSIQKSGDTLKSIPRPYPNRYNTQNRDKSTFRPNRVNSKALHPRTAGRFDAGQTRPAASRALPTGRNQQPPPRRPRSPPPPPPPRAHYNRR